MKSISLTWLLQLLRSVQILITDIFWFFGSCYALTGAIALRRCLIEIIEIVEVRRRCIGLGIAIFQSKASKTIELLLILIWKFRACAIAVQLPEVGGLLHYVEIIDTPWWSLRFDFLCDDFLIIFYIIICSFWFFKIRKWFRVGFDLPWFDHTVIWEIIAVLELGGLRLRGAEVECICVEVVRWLGLRAHEVSILIDLIKVYLLELVALLILSAVHSFILEVVEVIRPAKAIGWSLVSHTSLIWLPSKIKIRKSHARLDVLIHRHDLLVGHQALPWHLWSWTPWLPRALCLLPRTLFKLGICFLELTVSLVTFAHLLLLCHAWFDQGKSIVYYVLVAEHLLHQLLRIRDERGHFIGHQFADGILSHLLAFVQYVFQLQALRSIHVFWHRLLGLLQERLRLLGAFLDFLHFLLQIIDLILLVRRDAALWFRIIKLLLNRLLRLGIPPRRSTSSALSFFFLKWWHTPSRHVGAPWWHWRTNSIWRFADIFERWRELHTFFE